MNLLQNIHLAVIEYLYLVGVQKAHWRITWRSTTSFMQPVLNLHWSYWTNSMEL